MVLLLRSWHLTGASEIRRSHRGVFMMSAACWSFEDKAMLIISVIGFLVIREALNQAYEGGTGYGNTEWFISEQG